MSPFDTTVNVITPTTPRAEIDVAGVKAQIVAMSKMAGLPPAMMHDVIVFDHKTYLMKRQQFIPQVTRAVAAMSAEVKKAITAVQAFDDAVGIRHQDAFGNDYSVEEHPCRPHRRSRIAKKWLKRYGSGEPHYQGQESPRQGILERQARQRRRRHPRQDRQAAHAPR